MMALMCGSCDEPGQKGSGSGGVGGAAAGLLEGLRDAIGCSEKEWIAWKRRVVMLFYTGLVAGLLLYCQMGGLGDTPQFEAYE